MDRRGPRRAGRPCVLAAEASPLIKKFYAPGLLDLSGYRLDRTAPGEDWDRFVDSSPQRSVFVKSGFLEALGVPLGLWMCLKGGEPRAAVALIEMSDNRGAELHELVIYHGLMLAPSDPNQNIAQANT